MCAREVDNRVFDGVELLPSSACPSSHPLHLKAGDLTFVWTMPALWSLKCSRVAAISISLAPATERKLERVQSGLRNPAHICQSRLHAGAPIGAAPPASPPLKIITFIPGKTWTGATHCSSLKYAGGGFLEVRTRERAPGHTEPLD